MPFTCAFHLWRRPARRSKTIRTACWMMSPACSAARALACMVGPRCEASREIGCSFCRRLPIDPCAMHLLIDRRRLCAVVASEKGVVVGRLTFQVRMQGILYQIECF